MSMPFRTGKDFWSAIGAESPLEKDRIFEIVEEPYYGLIDILTWQSLRPILGLPQQGIAYANYTDPTQMRGAAVDRSSFNYPFYSAICTGEREVGFFSTDIAVSACWVSDKWLLGLDIDLTRALLYLNSDELAERISTEEIIEAYRIY